ncbi:MAG: HAD family hydrolase [Myxococcales bacterium]|nr:HAD family hydrolase [Myxococcales bacterium]
MSPLDGVRAVAFDLDGTLVDRDAAARAVLAEVLDEVLLPEALALDASGDGGPAFFAFLGAHARGLSSRDADDVAPWFRAALAARVAPASEAVAARVRSRRVPFAVVTNGGASQRVKLARSGLEVDHVLVSAELGVDKPSPRIYARAAAVLGSPPSTLLFVGDHPVNDVDGPARAGYLTLWLARGRAYPTGLRAPTTIVDSIEDAFAELHRRALC